jgi:transposase InsO family protein
MSVAFIDQRRATHTQPVADRPRDLVDRNFTATRPNQLWVSDFTYVATWRGFVFVAFVIDVFAAAGAWWMATPLAAGRSAASSAPARRRATSNGSGRSNVCSSSAASANATALNATDPTD